MVDRTLLMMGLDVREALVECDTQRAIADDGLASARGDLATANAELTTLQDDNFWIQSDLEWTQDFNTKLESIIDDIKQGPWKAVQYNLERENNMLDTIPWIVEDEWTTGT